MILLNFISDAMFFVHCRIRNAALQQVLRPALDRMSKPQTVTSGSCSGNKTVESQVLVNETSGSTDDSKEVCFAAQRSEEQGRREEKSLMMAYHYRTPDTSQRRQTRTTAQRATSSSADFFHFSWYSNLFQGRQPPMPFHRGAPSPCYRRHPRGPAVSIASGQGIQPLPASWTGPPHLSTGTNPDPRAKRYASHSATQRAKPETYASVAYEDTFNVNRAPCDREDPRLTGKLSVTFGHCC